MKTTINIAHAMKHSLLLLAGLLLTLASHGAEAAAYITRTNVDLQNQRIYGEVVYAPSEQCSRYALRVKVKVYRGGACIDSGYVKPLKDAIISNRNDQGGGSSSFYAASNDSITVTDLTVSGFQVKARLPVGVASTDSVGLSVEAYTLAARYSGVVGNSTAYLVRSKNIEAGCPYPSATSPSLDDPTLMACNLASTGAGARWEAFIRDSRDCNIYRTVRLPDGHWWFAENLNWGKAGMDYAGSRLYRWDEAVTGEYIPDTTKTYLKWNGSSATVGPQGVCPAGWHVPLASEWQQLGASIGSPAPWSGLPHLMGFTEGSDSWTTSTRPLRNTDDRYGFRWLADIFIPNISKGSYGVGGKNNITYGAFWSAGLGSNEDMFTEAIKRVAAAVDNGWASDPLAVDTVNGGPAGSKGRDFLPVRCVLGQGPMTAWIYDSDRYDDGYEAPEENPCTIGGCSCGIDAGTIFGGHNNCPAIEPGVIGVAEATVEVCKNIKHPGAIGCFPEE